MKAKATKVERYRRLSGGSGRRLRENEGGVLCSGGERKTKGRRVFFFLGQRVLEVFFFHSDSS